VAKSPGHPISFREGENKNAALQGLPILDVTSLTPKQLAAAVRLFDAMSGLDLPVHEIDKDPGTSRLGGSNPRPQSEHVSHIAV
jgi:hypothetical protein